MIIFFINSGFWCQSAVCKKLAANIKVSEVLAILAKAITLVLSPDYMRHFSDVILSPVFINKLEAI